MDAIIWIVGMSCIMFGFVIAKLESRSDIKTLIAHHKFEMKIEKSRSYRSGYNDGYEYGAGISTDAKTTLKIYKP